MLSKSVCVCMCTNHEPHGTAMHSVSTRCAAGAGPMLPQLLLNCAAIRRDGRRHAWCTTFVPAVHRRCEACVACNDRTCQSGERDCDRHEVKCKLAEGRRVNRLERGVVTDTIVRSSERSIASHLVMLMTGAVCTKPAFARAGAASTCCRH